MEPNKNLTALNIGSAACVDLPLVIRFYQAWQELNTFKMHKANDEGKYSYR